jgi:signal transduction histidine kinase
MLSRATDPLVRAVGRLPARVHTKLLVAFVGTVVLLVVVMVLGLRVLSDSNERVDRLGKLQLRTTVFRELQTDSAQLRGLLALRAGGSDLSAWFSGPSSAAPKEVLTAVDRTIATTLARIGPATNQAHFGFVPSADESTALEQIRQDYTQLSNVMSKITAFDEAGQATEAFRLAGDSAEPLVFHLDGLTTGLLSSTLAQTNDLIAENRSAFDDSQRLFIAVAAASVVLALLLGYILSWSLVGPIRRMETRLAGIASGDFSGRVEVPNRDELGSLAANINAMNDELGRLYKELEAASRHKSEFLANMSHELRTPLNAIIGFSQVLREQMFGELNEKQAEYLDDILTSGQHLLNLINDILDLSKVEAGRMELQPSVFPLADLLAGSMVMVRERATRQGVDLITDIDPAVGLVEADERKIKQVLFNLLSNAVKFTPQGGRITLAAHCTADAVEIAVIDTGIGIGADDQARIFDEFYQVGRAKTQEGTGLGLALTKRLVELHHGELRVESTPGAGSTFTVVLPLRLQPPQSEMAARTSEEPVLS